MSGGVEAEGVGLYDCPFWNTLYVKQQTLDSRGAELTAEAFTSGLESRAMLARNSCIARVATGPLTRSIGSRLPDGYNNGNG